MIKKQRVLIVGGGTAGLLIAENLKHQFNVTVIEKSEIRRIPFLNRIPLLIGLLYRERILKYVKRHDISIGNNRIIPFFESCVLGGSSVINGCVHAVGSKVLWDTELKKFALGFNHITDAYNKLFTSNIYSFSKKIKLRLAAQNSLDKYFFRTLEKIKFTNTGLLTADAIGYGIVVNTVGLFFRSTVLSLLRNPKPKIFTGNHLLKIQRINKYFEITTGDHIFQSDYVIISAGVVGTNLILLNKQISGIDDKFLLTHGIGANIKDHPNIRVNVRSSRSFGSINEVSESLLRKIHLLVKHAFGLETVLLGTGATSGIHLDLDRDGVVDTRIHLLQFSETGRHNSDGKDFCTGPGFSLSITPIQTTSSGTIRVDDFGVPTIDPGYFTQKVDLDRMSAALSFCIKLLESDPLKNYVDEIEDFELIKKDPETYIKKSFFSGHHLIGGCTNAIDGNFELKECPGIYVCDASVFTRYVSSNIHAPVTLLAKLFSDKFITRMRTN
jgi:choline dehydrogenase-like flavoprotein